MIVWGVIMDTIAQVVNKERNLKNIGTDQIINMPIL